MLAFNNLIPPHAQTGPQVTSDLWRSILHSRNIDESCRVTAFDLRRILDLAEPALREADRLGLAAGINGFWWFKGWLCLVDDESLSALSKAVAQIKKRLDRLISGGDFDAIDDHVWVAALDADCREEIWRRIRLNGSPFLGEGRPHDSMKVHCAIIAAQQAWREHNATEGGSRGNGA